MGLISEKKAGKLHRGKDHGLTVVHFGAPWCAPCSLQDPIMRELSRRYRGRVRMAAVDIDRNPDAAVQLGIECIPTVVIFRDGLEVKRFLGLQSADVLSAAIRSIQGAEEA
ncbi:thioredoxin family protein [Desulfatiglans anilini]|uniref:thioredoxin family protein n=1 Tax=Desulfatiglans anilini TaxID=90728 RepID=UPI0012CDBAA7|nr:thioredoxin family protein [Desulfatiglans anilini]VBB43706.1 Thioredoxin [uncultured Desulfatiglans sp.]